MTLQYNTYNNSYFKCFLLDSNVIKSKIYFINLRKLPFFLRKLKLLFERCHSLLWLRVIVIQCDSNPLTAFGGIAHPSSIFKIGKECCFPYMLLHNLASLLDYSIILYYLLLVLQHEGYRTACWMPVFSMTYTLFGTVHVLQSEYLMLQHFVKNYLYKISWCPHRQLQLRNVL
jgi:hypothetical protein